VGPGIIAAPGSTAAEAACGAANIAPATSAAETTRTPGAGTIAGASPNAAATGADGAGSATPAVRAAALGARAATAAARGGANDDSSGGVDAAASRAQPDAAATTNAKDTWSGAITAQSATTATLCKSNKVNPDAPRTACAASGVASDKCHIAHRHIAAAGYKKGATSAQATGPAAAGTYCRSTATAERLCVLNGQIVDGDIARIDEEAALHAAAVQGKAIAVDRDVARRIEGIECVRGSAGERNVVLESDDVARGAWDGVDSIDGRRKAGAVSDIDNYLRPR
jgi:hypothetical protein